MKPRHPSRKRCGGDQEYSSNSSSGSAVDDEQHIKPKHTSPSTSSSCTPTSDSRTAAAATAGGESTSESNVHSPLPFKHLVSPRRPRTSDASSLTVVAGTKDTCIKFKLEDEEYYSSGSSNSEASAKNER